MDKKNGLTECKVRVKSFKKKMTRSGLKRVGHVEE